MIKLLAFDLDGTIINDSKIIPPENLQALISAHEKEIILVPATGRPKSFIPKPVLDLDFIEYAITANGAGVYNLSKNTCIYQSLIPCETALKIQEILERLHIYAEYYVNADVYTINGTAKYRKDKFAIPEHRKRFLEKENYQVDDIMEFLKHEEHKLQKITMPYINPQTMPKLKEELSSLKDLYTTSSIEDELEINRFDATKGHGLEVLCEHLKIDISEVMAIGDSGNDLEMLGTAGVSVAMGNASENVKKTSKFLTDSCENNGFAKAVNKYILKSWFNFNNMIQLKIKFKGVFFW